MNEHGPEQMEKEAREQMKRDYLELGRELSEVPEAFPFPGMKQGVYSKIKTEEKDYPAGRFTPIDELVRRLKEYGMRVTLGNKYPENPIVYIVPVDTEDFENDSLFPRQLETTEEMDGRLKKLIALSSELENV